MKAPDKQTQPGLPLRQALLGVLLVARGRKDGLAQFGNTPQAVLAALAPLAAFLLVGGALSLLAGSREGLTDIAAVTVFLLGPLVLSFDLARRWDRAGRWPRFAAALCWCQWAGPPVLMAIMLLMATLMAGGVGEEAAAGMGLGLLVAYWLWLHWFLARHALGLGGWRAPALVAAINLLPTGLVMLSQWLDYGLNGAPGG